jgi:hypothetical protein
MTSALGETGDPISGKTGFPKHLRVVLADARRLLPYPGAVPNSTGKTGGHGDLLSPPNPGIDVSIRACRETREQDVPRSRHDI